MEVKLPLLRALNEDLCGDDYSLIPRFTVVVKASQLASWFRYKRQGKKTPYRMELDSPIQIDTDIQRGVALNGNLLQEEKKVNDVRDSLLGISTENHQVSLGTLIWNVREPLQEVFDITTTMYRDGRPPEHELRIKARHIYLTDSAHRHFGICEAFKTAAQDPAKYPRFSMDFEFPVEIYCLSAQKERMLFKELNGLRKNITKAKMHQMDSTSAIGALKDSIMSYDYEHEKGRLFYQNIEVNSNTNDRHTLMTMSAFTASMQEMFGRGLINDAKDDEGLRDDLVQHFCHYMYALRDELKVTCTFRNKEEIVRPFDNLYTRYILPAENTNGDYEDEADFERELQKVREETTARNQLIREQDKLNSNPFLKGLAWVGGYIRTMGDWRQVVELIQTKMITDRNGRYFQASNEILTTPNPDTGHSMATIKEDGTLNVQVQSHTVREIKNHFARVLELDFPVQLMVVSGGYEHALSEQAASYTQLIERSSETYLDLKLAFKVGSNTRIDPTQIKLQVTPKVPGEEWAEAKKRGKKAIAAASVARDESYAHHLYDDSVARYVAEFALDLPAYDKAHAGTFEFQLDVDYPAFNGIIKSDTFVLQCQAKAA